MKIVKIRRAGLLDLFGIHQVEKASFSDPWPLLAFLPYVLEKEALFFVAEDKKEVVGFILALREDEEIHIHDLAVHPEQRRKGVASALLFHLLSEAKDARRIRLEVRASNTAAQAFYKKHSFRAAAILPNYYEDGEDGIVMIRELSQ